jgi:ABC-type uncharacterized transport system involved in gliding motility auxiliary subunit
VNIPGEGGTIPNLTHTPLVLADPRAWGETNFEALQQNQFEQDPADTQPPLNLAVTVENTQTRSRLVVFGDSTFVADGLANQGANALLFANAVNWATVEENLINLTPKIPTTRSMQLVDALTINVIFLVTVMVLPLLILGLGVVVWLQRRRHI